jgi:hypothetical protein
VIIRYLAFVGGTVALFVNFVACGAQMYQVSLKDDTQVLEAEEKDPSSPLFGLHSPKGWRSLPIHFKVDGSLDAEQKAGLVKAMTTWEMAVGKKLFVFEGIHSGVTGDSFSDLYSSLDDRVNGHYLDEHWDKTGKPQVVLATTIWDNDPEDVKKILTADIRFNSNYYVIGNALKAVADRNREVVDMQTLALHELGHLLGLTHIPGNVDSESVMSSTVFIGEGLTNRKLSKGDLERVQRIYGCEGTACDVEQTLSLINSLDREKDKKRTAQIAH